MPSGRVRDFSKPDPDENKGPQILSQVRSGGVHPSQEPQPIEVTVHEEVVREGQDEIRRMPADDSGIEIRYRAPKNPEAWDEVKRGDG